MVYIVLLVALKFLIESNKYKKEKEIQAKRFLTQFEQQQQTSWEMIKSDGGDNCPD